jgi:uncharacterized glyoxalase superfamily protein PhnB
MHDAPEGWPRISSALFYDDAPKAIEWLGRAFGFEVRLKVEGEDGGIVHSELVFGDGLIMVASASRQPYWKSPRSIGGANTQSLFMYVDDVEAHCARARAAGATIATEMKTADYGDEWWVDRNYEAVDVEGHHWWFAQRMSTAKKK